MSYFVMVGPTLVLAGQSIAFATWGKATRNVRVTCCDLIKAMFTSLGPNWTAMSRLPDMHGEKR